MSDDFDPTLMPDGRVVYTRWEHFGTFNRFPLFFCGQDGTRPFHEFGPHDRNFFHPQATPDGRIIAIESTMVNEDAGPIAVLKLEMGPADPADSGHDAHWNRLTPQVNTDGAPWAYGAFKYPMPIGDGLYVVSYTLPAAEDEQVDYGLYTFNLRQDGAGTGASPATISIDDLTFLYNDPQMNEYDAQLLAPHAPPPVQPKMGDDSLRLRRVHGRGRVQPRGQRRPGSSRQGCRRDRPHRRDRRIADDGRRSDRLFGERVRAARPDRLRARLSGRLVPVQGAGRRAVHVRHDG